MPASDRDRETVRLLRNREEQGLRQLLHDHAPVVLGGLRREFPGASALALDAALNEAAHRAWRSISSFDETKGALRAWLYVIARNCARRVLAEESASPVRLFDPDAFADRTAPAEDGGGAEGEDPASKRPSLAVRVQEAIARLPELQRRIVEADLASGDVASAAELAERFGTSKNSIYVSRNHARKKLRALLEASAGSGGASRADTPPGDGGRTAGGGAA